MNPYLITAPEAEPVSLAEAKAQCEVPLDDGTRDALLEGLNVTARLWAESFMRRGLCTQTWDFKADAFPCAGEILEIPLCPVQSVTHVQYVDPDGNTQTWSPTTGYEVHGAQAAPHPWQERAYIVPRYGQAWPAPRLVKEAVVVRAVIGYGAPAAVPAAIKQAIKLRTGQLFAQREPAVTGTTYLDTGLDRALLSDFRSLRVA